MYAMVLPKIAPNTYQDILDLPEHLNGEIVDGELYAQARLASPHANTASEILAQIRSLFHAEPGGPKGPGGWQILMEPELHWGDNVFVPDLAGWRRERMPQIPSAPYLEMSPDWICEVLSPSTASRDRLLKCNHYARAGVGHVWLVDPELKTLEVLRLVDGFYSLVQGGIERETGKFEPFQSVETELGAWWMM